jgi:RimJ/RimL family protein N-acetyltransferase
MRSITSRQNDTLGKDELPMTGVPLVVQTARGPIALRTEQPADSDFLYSLFQSHALRALVALPVDAAMKESLVRMQFKSRTATYRARYRDARFAILEHHGKPIGRVVIDDSAEATCIVDLELIPESRGSGIGSALMIGLIAWVGARVGAVRCTVLSTNEASLRMCRRAGFVKVGDTPPHCELEWRRSG